MTKSMISSWFIFDWYLLFRGSGPCYPWVRRSKWDLSSLIRTRITCPAWSWNWNSWPRRSKPFSFGDTLQLSSEIMYHSSLMYVCAIVLVYMHSALQEPYEDTLNRECPTFAISDSVLWNAISVVLMDFEMLLDWFQNITEDSYIYVISLIQYRTIQLVPIFYNMPW